MLLTIVILGLLLLVSLILNFYFGSKLLNLFDKTEELANKNSELDSIIKEIVEDISNTYKNLKIVDDKQIFEKDEDVGFVFSDILTLIEKIKTKYDYQEENKK
jgi:hypothetical protein